MKYTVIFNFFKSIANISPPRTFNYQSSLYFAALYLKTQTSVVCSCNTSFKSASSNQMIERSVPVYCKNSLSSSLREWPFLNLGTGAEDFWQGHETFFHYFLGVRKY